MKKQTFFLVALMVAMPAVSAMEPAAPVASQQGWFAKMGNKFNEWTKTSPYLSQSMYGGGGVVVGLGLAAYFANKASKHVQAAQKARAELAVNPQNQEAQNAFNHHTKWRDIHYSMLAAASSAALVGGGVLGHGVLSHVRGSKAVADALPEYDAEQESTKQLLAAGEKLFETRGSEDYVRAERARAFNFMSRLGQQQSRPWWQRLLNPFYEKSIKEGDKLAEDGTHTSAVVDALRTRYGAATPVRAE